MKRYLIALAGGLMLVLGASVASANSCAPGAPAAANPACGVVYKTHYYNTCVPQEREVCQDVVETRTTCDRQEMRYPIDACPTNGGGGGGAAGCGAPTNCGPGGNAGGNACGNVRQYIPYSICVPKTEEVIVRRCQTETTCVPEQRCVVLPHCEGGDCGALCANGGCAPRACNGGGNGGNTGGGYGGNTGGGYGFGPHPAMRRALSQLPVVPANIPSWLRPVR